MVIIIAIIIIIIIIIIMMMMMRNNVMNNGDRALCPGLIAFVVRVSVLWILCQGLGCMQAWGLPSYNCFESAEVL